MTVGSMIELRANLKELKLSTMARNLEASFRQARESGIDYEEFLVALTTAELQARSENKLARRMREAKFPLLKPMETFDLEAVPELDIRVFRDLCGCDYIREKRNVIFSGRSGTGKTHMATALGIEACRNKLPDSVYHLLRSCQRTDRSERREGLAAHSEKVCPLRFAHSG